MLALPAASLRNRQFHDTTCRALRNPPKVATPLPPFSRGLDEGEGSGCYVDGQWDGMGVFTDVPISTIVTTTLFSSYHLLEPPFTISLLPFIPSF